MKQGRLLGLFLIVMSLAGAISYLIWQAPLGLYIGLVLGAIALAIVMNIPPSSLSISPTQIALTTSLILTTGAIVAEVSFKDHSAAWFFLIAAAFSLPLVLGASRYMRSLWLKEQEKVSEPEAPQVPQSFWQSLGELFIKGLSLGLTVVLLATAGYAAWRIWPKVSGNTSALALLLLIFLFLGSMVVERADKRPEQWLSPEGLRALSGILREVLLLVTFVLLLLNAVTK
jgi:hypothetical protein